MKRTDGDVIVCDGSMDFLSAGSMIVGYCAGRATR